MCKSMNTVSPTYSSIVEVPVPIKDDEEADIHCSVQKVNESISIAPSIYLSIY